MASSGRFFETLGLVFRVAFKSSGATLPIAASVGVPVAVVNAVMAAFGEGDPAAGAPFQVFVGMAAMILALAGTAVFIGLLVYPLVVAGLAWAGTRATAGGGVTLGDVAVRLADRGPRAAGAFLLAVLAAVAAPLALVPLAVVGAFAWPPAGALLGLLAVASFVYPGFVYGVRFSLAPAVAMSQDVTVTGALARSRELVRGHFWWVVGIIVCTGITASLIGSVVTAPFASAAVEGPAGAVGAGVAQAIATTVSTAITGVAAGVMYAVRVALRAEIRRATPDDVPAIATVHVESWRAAYAGLVPDEYLERLSVAYREQQWSETFDRWPTWVATADGDVVGFANCGVSRDADATPQTGELYAIYVAPAFYRHGIGRHLHEHVLTEMRTRGFTESTLWVLDGNTRARRFYERMGWTPDGATKTEERPGATLHEVRYRRSL